jgi:hypothetical protein
VAQCEAFLLRLTLCPPSRNKTISQTDDHPPCLAGFFSPAHPAPLAVFVMTMRSNPVDLSMSQTLFPNSARQPHRAYAAAEAPHTRNLAATRRRVRAGIPDVLI